MDRRNFLTKAVMAASATVSLGTVPTTLVFGDTKRELNSPICAGCKEPLVLKGKGTAAVISCSNDKCVAFWDDDLIERFYNVGVGVGLGDAIE